MFLLSSGAKYLLSPQQAVNDLSNQVIDNAKHTANMQWIIDKNAGIPKGELTNRPGLIIRKNPGAEVRRDSPPSRQYPAPPACGTGCTKSSKAGLPARLLLFLYIFSHPKDT